MIAIDPNQNRLCDALGVCQGGAVPCPACSSNKLDNVVYLSGSPHGPSGVGDRRFFPVADDCCAEEEDTCTVWEHMGYWFTVGTLAAATLAVVAGVVGFVWARWL